MTSRIRFAFDIAYLAIFVVLGNLAILLFGDCGAIYYYAAMAGLSSSRFTDESEGDRLHWWAAPFFSFVAMRKIREPLFLAQLAFQMRREVEEGEHTDAVRAHYARLSRVTEEEAESRQPGVVRLAWEARREASSS